MKYIIKHVNKVSLWVGLSLLLFSGHSFAGSDSQSEGQYVKLENIASLDYYYENLNCLAPLSETEQDRDVNAVMEAVSSDTRKSVTSFANTEINYTVKGESHTLEVSEFGMLVFKSETDNRPVFQVDACKERLSKALKMNCQNHTAIDDFSYAICKS